MKFNKRNKIIVTLILVMIAIIFILTKVTGKSTGASEDVTYVTATVEKGTITSSVSGSGSLTSSSATEVKSQANAEIESINVEVGDSVKKGDVVTVLNDDSAQLALDKANNTYNQAISEQQKISNDLSNLNINSTTNGIITKLNANSYQNIQQGAVVAEVVNDSTMSGKVYFDNAELLSKFSTGQTVTGTTLSGKSFSATISHINSSQENISGANYYSLTLKINNSNSSFKDGENETITISKDGNTVNSLAASTINYTSSAVSMVSKTEGEISKVNYSVGSKVSKGQTIAVISSDSIKENLANQKLTVKEALLNLNNAKEEKSNLELKATQDGTVSAITLSEGDVATGSIMTITNYDNLNVVIPVDELDLAKIKLGQQANITSDIYEDKTFEGTITNIALEGVATNGVTTFDVTIAMDDKEDLKVGMTVNVDIIIEQSKDVPILPVEAVQKDDKGYFVYKTSETKAVTDEILAQSKTYVEKGLTNDAYVEITNGLAEKDVVIYQKATTDSSNSMIPGLGKQMNQGERPNRSPDSNSTGGSSAGGSSSSGTTAQPK